MPCYDSRDNERSDNDLQLREVVTDLRTRMDGLTRVACDLAAVLRAGGTFSDLNPVTVQWVERHEEWDERRKRVGQ